MTPPQTLREYANGLAPTMPDGRLPITQEDGIVLAIVSDYLAKVYKAEPAPRMIYLVYRDPQEGGFGITVLVSVFDNRDLAEQCVELLARKYATQAHIESMILNGWCCPN